MNDSVHWREPLYDYDPDYPWVLHSRKPQSAVIGGCSIVDVSFDPVGQNRSRTVDIGFVVTEFVEEIPRPGFLPWGATSEYSAQLHFRHRWASDEFYNFTRDTTKRAVEYAGSAELQIVLPSSTEKISQIYPAANVARYPGDRNGGAFKLFLLFPARNADTTLIVIYQLPSAPWARPTVAVESLLIAFAVSFMFFSFGTILNWNRGRRQAGGTNPQITNDKYWEFWEKLQPRLLILIVSLVLFYDLQHGWPGIVSGLPEELSRAIRFLVMIGILTGLLALVGALIRARRLLQK